MPTRKPLDPDIKCLLHEMKAQVQPGHPFRSGIAAYAAYLAKHPNEVARVRHLATYLESMLLVGDAMKALPNSSPRVISPSSWRRTARSTPGRNRNRPIASSSRPVCTGTAPN
jgi:hypothetical protein